MKWRLLILLLFSSRLFAQVPSLYFEKITVQDGLSHNKVNCIMQDKRGFIWMGTDDGLNRYDGKRFIHYRCRQNDTTTISGNIITDLHEDASGKIWIASADGGLICYDYSLPPQLQFRQYRHHPSRPQSIPTNTINTISEDRHGNLWLGTAGHDVIRFDKRTGNFKNISGGRKTILDLCADKDGLIWVGRQGGGLMKINSATLSAYEDERYRNLYANLPHVTVTALHRDRNNRMWYGSWDKTLYRHDPVTGIEEVFTGEMPFGFKEDEVLSFAEDRSGRLWMGGKEHGLQIYHPHNGHFYQFAHDPSREGSVSDNRINCIFIDRQERVWLGTNRGVSVNNPDKQQFSQVFLPVVAGKSVVLYDMYEDESGMLWMGTSNGLVMRAPSGQLVHKPLVYQGQQLAVTSIYKDPAGQYYLGTNYSLFKYNPVAHTIMLLKNTGQDGVMNKLIESRIVSIVQHNVNGRPVLMTAPYGHFITYYDPLMQRWVSRLDSSNIVQRWQLKDNLIGKIYVTKSGKLYIATGKAGLGMWSERIQGFVYFSHDPSDPSSISNNHVMDLAEDASGNLWVSTYGGGLNYFDVRTGKFAQVPASNNLVEGIQTDHYGHVWMISNGHLHKYDPARKTYTSFDLPDLEKTGGVKGRIFRDKKGRLFLHGNGYYISFHPDSIRENKSQLKVLLTDFQIFNRSFSHLLMQEEIRLKYKDNYFSFEFAAPQFTGNNVYYSYKLEGFDEDWIDAGERNYISYPNLEGGHYTFKVRAGFTPGIWSQEMATADIIIVPPFWKSAWFYILCVVLLLAGAYFIYRYRINELLKRQAIRNKIAQDLHDNVGSTLSSISVYSQVARIYHNQEKQNELNSTLEKISATSSEMISELNDTVWAINPRNDNMDVILQRMDSFAKPLLAAQGIQFSLHYDAHIKVMNMDMEKRKNFYLIFKEAINNALKYSACSKVHVEVRQRAQLLVMNIEDDGKGFDMASTSEGYKSSDVFGGGNGLKNMQLRAREMKGILSISSESGRGTMVELQFPIT